MRYLSLIGFLTLCFSLLGQQRDTRDAAARSGVVSFVTTIDKANATKDGIYLNGYVVNLRRTTINKLHGKKVRVTGKVTIVRGITQKPGEPVVQGRESDTKYIKNPKIAVIEN